MLPNVATSVLLAAAVLLAIAPARPAEHADRNWGDIETRHKTYQQHIQRPPPRHHAASSRETDTKAFAAAVARTRKRVKCRDSDIILVSYPKARRPTHPRR